MANDKLACWGTPAQLRLQRRVVLSSLAFAVVLIPIVYAVRHGYVAGPWRTVLALVPAIPLIALFASYSRYLSEETDEYVRTLVVKSILSATTVTMVCTVVWGCLVEIGGAPPIALWWVAFAWIFAQGVSSGIVTVRG